MKSSRKFWLWLAGGVVLVMALPFLLAAFWPEPKGTATPPPGPHKAGAAWLADLGGKATMKMIWCPPGKFMMGSPKSSPLFQEDGEGQSEMILLQGFWLGKYEVTQKQWQALMKDNPSGFPGKTVVMKQFLKWKIPVWRTDFFASHWQLPVEQVTWENSQVFCQKAGGGFRLPTETEWGYACRADGSMPKQRDQFEEIVLSGCVDRCKTHAVGTAGANAWGFSEMYGNVWEWCQDNYKEPEPKPDLNIKGPRKIPPGGFLCNPHVARSGRCRAGFDDYAHPMFWDGPNESVFASNESHSNHRGLRLAFSTSQVQENGSVENSSDRK